MRCGGAHNLQAAQVDVSMRTAVDTGEDFRCNTSNTLTRGMTSFVTRVHFSFRIIMAKKAVFSAQFWNILTSYVSVSAFVHREGNVCTRPHLSHTSTSVSCRRLFSLPSGHPDQTPCTPPLLPPRSRDLAVFPSSLVSAPAVCRAPYPGQHVCAPASTPDRNLPALAAACASGANGAASGQRQKERAQR